MAKHADVTEELAERVFTMVAGFSGFGFPKAHGAAFGLLAYQSTWLRVHYGPEFLCALLNEQPMGFYASDTLVHEAQRRHDATVELSPGGTVTERWLPVRRVGLYVPGGLLAYPSSVVMNVVPAQLAGVASLAVASPPQKENTGDFAGLTVPPQIKKLGYKGVESTELVFDGYRCPAENVLGGEEAGLNRGFSQMMDALEVGRVNVAARGVGIAQRALELGLRYSQERKTFGKPIAEHQAIQFKLADMATQVDAARLLTLRAARLKDAGERSDLEAGMAKLFASEAGRFCVEECLRIHGGYGYSKEYEIERLYRDAPLLLIGEGTSEIQRMVIGRKLLQRHKI